METTHLNHRSVNTLTQIFQHPASHNLEWHDVIALVEHLGTVDENDGGHLKFTVNGVSQSFHRSSDKDISDVHQILELRHLMEHRGPGKHGAPERAVHPRLVVVVNQQEARVFSSDEKGTVPEHLYPYDPRGLLHHQNSTMGRDIGSHLPENLAYYEAIAETLGGAEEILFLGNGTAGSSAMTHLQEYLATHHPEVSVTIAGALTLDLEALTEGQLLEHARTFFAQRDGLDIQ